jgi:ADP-heptose:LPS heptosyltransferase
MSGTASSRRILVIKLGALGDFIQALGPMAAIRRHHPHDHITLLTTNPYAGLGQACGYFDDVSIDTRPKWFDFKGWKELREALNAAQFARVYDLQNNDRTSFYLKLFSPRPEWSGAAKGASLRNSSPGRTHGTAFEGHKQTLAIAGIQNVELDRLEWMQGNPLQGLVQPYVLVVPGSAPSRPEKRWPAQRFANICARLVVRGCLPVLIGAQGEKQTLDSIGSAVPEALNLCGKTSLYDLPALARGAIGAIGNDTGPMHLIAPTGCKSIVLFSKHSNPKRQAPLGQHVITLQKPALEGLSADEVWKAFELQQATPS